MYLLAIKSFVHQLGSSPQIVLLDDGSLTETDESILHAHISSLRIVPIQSIGTGSCPTGSCWERLMLISDLVQDGYVVQLDADTLTLTPIPEVLDAIDTQRSFTLLGDRSYPEIEPMLQACARFKDNLDEQVQAVCERSFDLLPESKDLRYLRGNAGFVGYAKNSIGRERIAWFSDVMRQIAKGTWDQWGSEQLTSNLLIANSSKSLALPAPRYVSYWAHPDISYEDAAFIHFIGPHRFSNNFYIRSARRVLAQLEA